MICAGNDLDMGCPEFDPPLNYFCKSLRNCKRRNKGNLILKSNSNKLMLSRGGGKQSLVLTKIST